VTGLRNRLCQATTWPQRFALLDDAMTGLLRDRAEVHPDVAYAFDRLVDSGGEVTIADLAAEIGWSARHLTNRFRAEVGLRPKETARIVRFDRARRLLGAGVRPGDAAARSGYFDHAHLTREFQALAGVAPTRWLADEIGFVQATPGAAGAR
jgi:AraC-like DNA-binding protein